jgi:anti-sigma28 factor (negative regulator of flagellin synthesis)
MSMRIDGHRLPGDAEMTRRLESARTADLSSGPAAVHGPGQSADRVDVSPEAQLVSAAIQAAHDAPAVRPEAVERGRLALERGSLGQDTTRLADRIIDALLKG